MAKPTNRLTLMSLLAMLAWGGSAQALQINALVTDNAGVFHYEVTVLNEDPTIDLAVISIDDAPFADPLIEPSLTAPDGFFASYDTLFGILDLLADTASFAADLAVGPFSFDSLSGPDLAFNRYSALTFDGDVISGDVAIEFAQAVPVPGSLLLFALGLGLLARRSTAPASSTCYA